MEVETNYEDDNEQYEADATTTSYQKMIHGLMNHNVVGGCSERQQRRDPRALRLAAVTAALVDLASSAAARSSTSLGEEVGDGYCDDHDEDVEDDGGRVKDEHNEKQVPVVSAAQVYARAMTALEGTLTSNKQATGDAMAALVDSWATQAALLELLTVTVPHVHPVGIIQATLPLFSRVMRAVVTSALDTALLGGKMDVDNEYSNQQDRRNRNHVGLVTETKDELGGSNAVLRGGCRAVASYLQRLQEAGACASLDHSAMHQLFMSTLVHLCEDSRPKVRKAAQTAALQVVLSPMAHSTLRRSTSQYFHNTLVQARKQLEGSIRRPTAQSSLLSSSRSSSPKETLTTSTSPSLLHRLAMLEQCIVRLDFAVLSKDVMQLLTVLFQVDATMVAAASSSSEYITAKIIHKVHHHPFLLQSLLSVIVKALEPEDDNNEERGEIGERERSDSRLTGTKTTSQTQTVRVMIHEWSGRVLATLLTVQPAVLFRSGSAPDEVLERGRSLYGCAVLAALQSVVMYNHNTNLAYRLLPVSIQMVLLLSKPVERSGNKDEQGEDDENDVVVVANTLLVDLSRLFRSFEFKQIMTSEEAETNSERKLLVERCTKESLKSLQAILRQEFRPCWSVGLKTLAIFLQEVVVAAAARNLPLPHEASSTLEVLVHIRNQVPPGSPSQRSIEDALSTLVQGIGIEATWPLISWQAGVGAIKTKKKDDHDDGRLGISVDRAWVLVTMKSAALTAQPKPPNLAFFHEHILAMARHEDRLAAATTAPGTETKKNSSLYHRARVVDLWSHLPCFCKAPADVAERLPALAVVLAKAIEDSRYPQLVSIISRALSILCGESSSGTQYHQLSKQEEDAATAEALREASHKLLPVLFKLIASASPSTSTSQTDNVAGNNNMMIDTLSPNETMPQQMGDTASDVGQQTQVLSDAIADLARHAQPKFLQGLFKKLMHKLLDELKSDSRDENRICSFLCLSQALVVSETLDESNISFLYRTLKPFVRSQEETGAHCQKRAYKVLAEMCERNHSYLFSDVDRLKEMTELLSSGASSSQVSARHMRMKCLKHIVEGLDATAFSSNSSLLAEIVNNSHVLAETLLCLKDTNAKTREAAYQLILAMASKQRGRLDEFLSTVTAALGAETPHMRSAAVMALSRIVYEFAWDDNNEEDGVHRFKAALPSLLSTVLVLINENSREVMKSVIGFIRISVAGLGREQMEPLLPNLIQGLLGFHKTKNRFRAKIKIILKKLVKKFGYHRLMSHVPESETRLLVHMRKLDERQKRRKDASKQAEGGELLFKHDTFHEMLESDEEDSDDGRTFTTGATGFTKMTGRNSLKTSNTKGPKSAASQTRATTTTNKEKKQRAAGFQLPDETDGEVVDMLGASMAKRVKFVDNRNDDSDDDDDDSDGVMEFDEEGRLVIHDVDNSSSKAESTTLERAAKKQRTGLSKRDKKVEQRNQNQTKNQSRRNRKEIGAAYKSKKAGGDVKRKDQTFEPYAFVPLDGKSYSRKNRRTAVESMSSVVRRGKKRKQA